MTDGRLRRWREAARKLRPVFVVGAPRSGTSIVYRCLQTHPSFRLPQGLQLVESHAIAELPRTFGMDGYWDHPPIANFMAAVDPWREFLEDIEPLRRRRLAVRRLPRPVTSRAVWTPAGEHHVLRRYFLGAHQSRGAARLVEKTPTHTPWIGLLHQAFPNAKFVYVKRHPVDVLGSYWDRHAAEPDTAAWAGVDAATLCARWMKGVRQAAAAADAFPGQVLILRYESFTSDPETAVRALLAHVDEPFDEACLLREATDARSDLADVNLWQPLRAEGKHWQERVPRAVAEEVEDRLAAEMARSGYDRYTPVG